MLRSFFIFPVFLDVRPAAASIDNTSDSIENYYLSLEDLVRIKYNLHNRSEIILTDRIAPFTLDILLKI